MIQSRDCRCIHLLSTTPIKTPYSGPICSNPTDFPPSSYVTLSLPPTPPTQTPVIKRSLNPHFPAAGSTFDFPLYASLAESGLYRGRGLEVVVWDKDIVKKDYMGEVAVPLAQWFPEEQGNVLWDPSAGEKDVRAFPLVSAKRRRRVTGRVFLQFGIVLPESTHADGERRAREVVRDLRAKGDRHLASLMGVPAVSPVDAARGLLSSAYSSRSTKVSGRSRSNARENARAGPGSPAAYPSRKR